MKPKPGSCPFGGFVSSFQSSPLPNGKLLINRAPRPSRGSERLSKEFHALRGSNVAAVMATISPIIRGWVAYYRTVVSSSVFHAPDRLPMETRLQVAC